MRYATWRLKRSNGLTYTGPINLILSAGGSVETIFATYPSPETYLSKFDGDISSLDLSPWGFVEITKDEALLFIDTWFNSNKPNNSDLPNFLSGVISIDEIKSKL